jgi:hypothetical protein
LETTMLDDQVAILFDSQTLEGRKIILSPPKRRGPSEAIADSSFDLLRVNLCIPTRNLESYIVETLEALGQTLRTDLEDLRKLSLVLNVVVLSNGKLPPENLDLFLNRLLCNGSFPVALTLIHTSKPGKSNALNLLHWFATATGVGQLVFIDDDVKVAPGVLPRLCRRLASRLPAFLGVPTIPVLPHPATQTSIDIYCMSIAKRNGMGFPMPIGRFMALPTVIYPGIDDNSVNDDVFLSAHFFHTGVPQEVLDLKGVTYNVSSSLSEFIKRKRRISTSDLRIVGLVPDALRSAYYKACIAPDPVATYTDVDRVWRRIENDLYEFATLRLFPVGSEADLTETDLSTKPSFGYQHSSRGWEEVLHRELTRLKFIHLGASAGGA